jgi:hypothetical protein
MREVDAGLFEDLAVRKNPASATTTLFSVPGILGKRLLPIQMLQAGTDAIL